MALQLKSLSRREFVDLDRRARNNDPEALDWFGSIWSEADRHSCFFCDVVVAGEHAIDGKPFAMILPETSGYDQMILAPHQPMPQIAAGNA
jgi:hypothetical protein